MCHWAERFTSFQGVEGFPVVLAFFSILLPFFRVLPPCSREAEAELIETLREKYKEKAELCRTVARECKGRRSYGAIR